MSLKLLLDIDPGLDDAAALLLALSDPAFDLRAVTTTFGSVPLQQATRNAQWLCHLAQRSDVPVCAGLASPLRKAVIHHDPQRQGHDGLGDYPTLERHTFNADERSAARCIVDLAHEFPGQLNVVTGGPLGNVVQALRLEPQLPQLLARVVVAGGCLAGDGDVSPVAEYNFWQDPHAADQVLTAGFRLVLCSNRADPMQSLLPSTHTSEAGSPLAHFAEFLRLRLTQLACDAPGASLGPLRLGTCAALRYLSDPDSHHVFKARGRVVTDGLAQGQLILSRTPCPPWAQPGWEDDIPELDVVTGSGSALNQPG